MKISILKILTIIISFFLLFSCGQKENGYFEITTKNIGESMEGEELIQKLFNSLCISTKTNETLNGLVSRVLSEHGILKHFDNVVLIVHFNSISYTSIQVNDEDTKEYKHEVIPLKLAKRYVKIGNTKRDSLVSQIKIHQSFTESTSWQINNFFTDQYLDSTGMVDLDTLIQSAILNEEKLERIYKDGCKDIELMAWNHVKESCKISESTKPKGFIDFSCGDSTIVISKDSIGVFGKSSLRGICKNFVIEVNSSKLRKQFSEEGYRMKNSIDTIEVQDSNSSTKMKLKYSLNTRVLKEVKEKFKLDIGNYLYVRLPE